MIMRKRKSNEQIDFKLVVTHFLSVSCERIPSRAHPFTIYKPWGCQLGEKRITCWLY